VQNHHISKMASLSGQPGWTCSETEVAFISRKPRASPRGSLAGECDWHKAACLEGTWDFEFPVWTVHLWVLDICCALCSNWFNSKKPTVFRSSSFVHLPRFRLWKWDCVQVGTVHSGLFLW